MAAAAQEAHQHAEQVANELTHLPASPKMGGSGEGPSGEVNRCLVYCRLRPDKPLDYEDEQYKLINMHGKTVKVKEERDYTFDGTFDQDCEQEDIFNTIGQPTLEYALKGHCTALLAYGQTGSGKSFTLINSKGPERSWGILPRSAKWLFDKIGSDTERDYTVVGQAVQIYRDNLGDLLQEGGKEKVDIRFDNDGVTLTGAQQIQLHSAEEFMAFFHEADGRRVVASTLMNPESSRGHTAIILRVKSLPKDPEDCGGIVNSKLAIIDLAGYERFSKTGIGASSSISGKSGNTQSDVIRKDEAKTINASLLSLGHVVTSLSNGDKHIPWRNSKLTRLLQDSIGGKARTTLILTVGPGSGSLHESTNTLQLGLKAMAVKVASKISAHVDYEKLATKLQALLDEREQKINSLELQLATFNAEREELQERHMRDEDTLRMRQKEELEKLRKEGASEDRITEVNTLHEVEVENLKEQQREELSYQQEEGEKEMKALMEEQARMTKRKEEEAKTREESRLKELEEKLAAARGADSTADLERCLKQLAERDAVLVSRAGERARLQALCATLIQQVRQLGGTPTHGGEFDENFIDIIQVEEIKSMLEMQVQALQTQSTDLRMQLANVQEVASERAAEVQSLRQQIETSSGGGGGGESKKPDESADGENKQEGEDSAAVAAAAGDDDNEKKQQEQQHSSTLAGTVTSHDLGATQTGQLVDKSEVETVRTLMQVDIDMLNCKVKMLEAQLTHAGLQPGDAGSALGIESGGGVVRNESFTGSVASADSPSSSSGQVTGRRRRNTVLARSEAEAAAGGAVMSTPSATSVSGAGSAAAGGGGGGGGASGGSNNAAEAVKQANEMRTRLLSVESANVALSSHVKYLEGLVSEMGGVAMDAPKPEVAVTVENVVATATDIAKAKNEEMDRLMSLLDAREAVINDQATQIGTLSEDARRSRESGGGGGGGASVEATPGTAATTAPHNPQQTKQFIELVRAARAAQRAAEEKLYSMQQRQAVVKLSNLLDHDDDGASASSLLPRAGGPAPTTESGPITLPQGEYTSSQAHFDCALSATDSLLSPKYAPKSGTVVNSLERATTALGGNPDSVGDELAATLRMNDDKLLEAETRVIDLEAQNASLKRMVAALERQLEIANMQPVCGLSKEDRDGVDAEHAKETEASQAAQEELSRQLQAQLEEKARIESMLDDLSKQRAKDAAVYGNMKEQIEEQKASIAAKVEEDRKESQQEMQKLQAVAEKHAAEAARLKKELEDRERKDAEQTAEAQRVRDALQTAEKAQAEKEEEAVRLRQELEKATGAGTDAEKLKQQLEENTRALMAAQAKKQSDALEAEEKKSEGGFFSRMKNWKL